MSNCNSSKEEEKLVPATQVPPTIGPEEADTDFLECDLMEINPDARYTPDGSFPGLES